MQAENFLKRSERWKIFGKQSTWSKFKMNNLFSILQAGARFQRFPDDVFYVFINFAKLFSSTSPSRSLGVLRVIIIASEHSALNCHEQWTLADRMEIIRWENFIYQLKAHLLCTKLNEVFFPFSDMKNTASDRVKYKHRETEGEKTKWIN